MALEGSLQDMSLADLFQIFRMGPKSGVLLLAGGSERGVIYVCQGRLIDAALVRGSECQAIATGEEAVIQLLQWEDATFVFRHDLAVAGRTIRIFHDSEWLMLEGIRRRENPLRLLPHQQITLDSQLELASLPSSAESGVNLDLDQWRILSQISISQNVREICKKTGMGPDKAIHTVSELIAIGLVEVAPPATLQRKPVVQNRSVLQPVAAGGGGLPERPAANAALPGRGLLNAIMRRVRGL